MMFESGINGKYFKYLGHAVQSMNEIDKNCILVWDEMALTPHIDYSPNRDVIDGFVEMILMRRPSFATHALVFMARGINRQYKQPLSYFYTDGLKHFELVEMVKLVGVAVLDAGLKILASVCDQCQTNVSTINALMRSNPETATNGGVNRGQLLSYKLRDTTVIHVFDVPHLLKGTRNNLQTKVLKHFVSKRWSSTERNSTNSVKKSLELTATWKDISETYDCSLKGSGQLLKKITPEHIEPHKLKMKVSTAAQVFSATYGKVMMDFSESVYLKRDLTGTANALFFFNDLFDSLNGSSLTVNQLKSPVTKNSHHFQFWDYALNMLSKMRFIDPATGEASNRTKNLQNWESTIRGYYELSKKCLDLGIMEIALRYCV
ncbi:uncharacterized protein LOC119081969 [Bradysia coprophila]|uniref:uncharacterized protein LOC119081969 n=1 Tax=Bradysia coprophila TaxID=38358 RepID=UPI00187DCD23|nr:uncharacterized protein LOC119081969 [Bradysia coprophila]